MLEKKERRKRRQRFLTWCRKDQDDNRRIHYTCNVNGETFKFTSDDEVEFSWIWWLRLTAMIDNIELVNNEWYVELSE